MIYRVYIAGREFGIDYTRAEALRVAAQYRAWLPGRRYYARKVRAS